MSDVIDLSVVRGGVEEKASERETESLESVVTGMEEWLEVARDDEMCGIVNAAVVLVDKHGRVYTSLCNQNALFTVLGGMDVMKRRVMHEIDDEL